MTKLFSLYQQYCSLYDYVYFTLEFDLCLKKFNVGHNFMCIITTDIKSKDFKKIDVRSL